MKFNIDSNNYVNNSVFINCQGFEPVLIAGNNSRKPINTEFEIDVVEGADPELLRKDIADKLAIDSENFQVYNLVTFIFTCLHCYRIGRNSK